jgi:hypothetical protein
MMMMMMMMMMMIGRVGYRRSSKTQTLINSAALSQSNCHAGGLSQRRPRLCGTSVSTAGWYIRSREPLEDAQYR